MNTTRHGLAARSRKNCTHAACPGSEGNRASTATLVSSNSASGGDQSGAWKERTPRSTGGRPLRATGYRRRPRRARTKSTCTSVLMRLVARSMFAIRSSTSAIRGGCTRARHDSAPEDRPLREARRLSTLLAIGPSYPTIHSPSSNSGCGQRLLGQPERGSLGVLADRPVLPGVDDASTERLDVLQRLGYVAHREVGQRKRIPRSASARMNTDRWAVRAGLPPCSLSLLARLQLNSQKLRPEAPGALGIVCGELDRGQRGVRHRSHDSLRTSRSGLTSTTQVQSAGRPIRFRTWRG